MTVQPVCDSRAVRRARLASGALTGLLCLLAGYAFAGSSDSLSETAPKEEQAPLTPDELLFASPTTHDHIGRVVVPVKVNGQGPFRFIVDTGANHSTISPELVRTLGLTPSEKPQMVLDGITGTAQVSVVNIDSLQAGDLTLDNTALPVVWAPVMAGADGILGAATLTEKSLFIDFRGNQVAISKDVKSAAKKQSTRIHASRVPHGLLALEVRVAGIPVLAVIDTGSERTLGNIALRDALRSKKGAQQGFVATLTSVYGATKEVETGEIQAAPLISIDALRITNVAIVFGDFHIFKVWEMQKLPSMIIGMDVLGTVASLSIDYRNNDVYVAGSPGGTGQNVLQVMRGITTDSSQRR